MLVPRRRFLTIAFSVLAFGASAYSLSEHQSTLGDREKYFQPIDKDAPGFTLADADGHGVSLADFRSNGVVLHFISTTSPHVCPLHAATLPESQPLDNHPPMQAQVQFISLPTDPSTAP